VEGDATEPAVTATAFPIDAGVAPVEELFRRAGCERDKVHTPVALALVRRADDRAHDDRGKVSGPRSRHGVKYRVGAIVDVMDVRPRTYERVAVATRYRVTDSYRYARALLVIFLATAIDVFNFLDRSSRGGPLRYVILLIPILSLLAVRADGSTLIRRPTVYERVLIILFAFGLIGTTYGILFLGVTSTARALFLPMSIAILALFVVDPLTPEETRRLTKALAVIATVYIVLGAIVYSGVVPGLAEYRQFKNATFPYVAIGVSAAWMLGRRSWAVALVALATVMFLGYPSATSVLVALITVVTYWATARTASRARPYLIAAAVLLIGIIAIANFSESEFLADRYFEAVGKRNTSQGRVEFWTSGIAEFAKSPIIGTAFASDTVVESSRERRSPYHNDFVMFLAEGGVLGSLLLVAFIVSLLRQLVTRYFGFVRIGDEDRARFARLLLIGLNSFLITMVFNPVLAGLSRSATIFALVAFAAALGKPERPDEVTDRSPAVAASSATGRIRVR
jgi:O-antigen ligase